MIDFKFLVILVGLVLSATVVAAVYVPDGMSSTVEQFCEDSDGTNFYHRGTVEDADGTYEDKCSVNFLIEYICDGKYHDRLGRQCEFGCDDGACNSPLVEDAQNAEISKDADETPEPTLLDKPIETPSKPSVQQHIKTDIGAVNPTISIAPTRDEFKEPITTSRTKHMVPLSDTDPYELTDNELRSFTQDLAEVFDEDQTELYERSKQLKAEGRLNEEIDRLKKKHPVRARLAMMLIKRKNPELFARLQRIENVGPELLQQRVAVLEQSVGLRQAFEEKDDVPYLKRYRTEGVRVIFPQDYDTTEPFVINMSDPEGGILGALTIKAKEDGTIEKMTFSSAEERVLIKSANNRLINLKAHIEVELKNITKDAGFRLMVHSIPEKDINFRFKQEAGRNGLSLSERAGVLRVDKFLLSNRKEIGEAKIIFKFEGNLLGRDKPETVKILRVASDKTEVLSTKYEGNEDGLLVFSASSEGLSTFAAFITDNITPTGDGESKTSMMNKLQGLILPLFLVITVGAAFVGSVLYSGKVRKKK